MVDHPVISATGVYPLALLHVKLSHSPHHLDLLHLLSTLILGVLDNLLLLFDIGKVGVLDILDKMSQRQLADLSLVEGQVLPPYIAQ